jgi:P-type E1-E2 ATPase
VPGDIVEVKGGDRIPADIRISKLVSISVQIEEAPLTGESVSVQKEVKPMGKDAKVLQDQRNMLFSSTVVNAGTCQGIVCFTGMTTAIGRVCQEVKEAQEEEEDSPLKQKID